jgi:Spy/CpxP family protein refolding chaperone
MRAINDRDHKAHQALFDLIRNGQDSTSASDSLINEIAQNKKETEAATFHHLVQLRKICTPDQQKQFDGFVLDLFEHRQGPPPPGGRP